MNPVLDLGEAYLRRKYPVARILLPTGGLLSGVSRLEGGHTTPDFDIAVSNLDNVTKVFPHVRGPDGKDVFNEPLGGAGADVNTELAWLRAVMEGAERYANMAYSDDDFIVATANELGTTAIDLDRLARCSERELTTKGCPFTAPDKSLPIRWTRGYSLTDRCERLVPAVTTHIYLHPSRADNFWQQISTGVAAHFDPAEAMVSAICEVIERDATAMVWLARLGLPRIELTQPLPPVLADNYRVLQRSLVRHIFFDATTDVGIPTVYAVQLLQGHPHTAQYVNCACGFSAAAACAKTIREAAPARPALEGIDDVPRDVREFRSLYDGAHHLGRPEHRGAFDFLLDSPRRMALADMEIDAPASAGGRLRYLVERLRSLDLEVVMVDLTSDELRRLGVWVVRAVVPGLMPMSSVQRGRFLGTPRLYAYPRRAGYGQLTEDDINPLPQPFA